MRLDVRRLDAARPAQAPVGRVMAAGFELAVVEGGEKYPLSPYDRRRRRPGHFDAPGHALGRADFDGRAGGGIESGRVGPAKLRPVRFDVLRRHRQRAGEKRKPQENASDHGHGAFMAKPASRLGAGGLTAWEICPSAIVRVFRMTGWSRRAGVRLLGWESPAVKGLLEIHRSLSPNHTAPWRIGSAPKRAADGTGVDGWIVSPYRSMRNSRAEPATTRRFFSPERELRPRFLCVSAAASQPARNDRRCGVWVVER
jgi:hypothetical protein